MNLRTALGWSIFPALCLLAALSAPRLSSPLAGEVPIGSITAYAGEISSIPDGWLLCDGAALRQSDYPDLFAVIGTSHGPGVTETGAQVVSRDFNLPDYRGQFLRGVDHDRNGVPSNVDPEADRRQHARGGKGNSGNVIGSTQSDSYASHSHGINDPGHTHRHRYIAHTGGPPLAGGAGYWDHTDNIAESASSTTGITIIAGGGSETRPKNVAVYWIIRAK